MSNFEFAGSLFRNAAEMHASIAHEYLSAGGLNSATDQAEVLAHSATELADSAIWDWELSATAGFDRAALVAAFRNLGAQ